MEELLELFIQLTEEEKLLVLIKIKTPLNCEGYLKGKNSSTPMGKNETADL